MLALVSGGVTYATTPLPRFPAQSLTTQIQYSDGTSFATFATENRVEVSLDRVPKHVQDAVVAAEDADFWTNGGVSLRGTGRALCGREIILAQKLGRSGGKAEILHGYLNTIYFGRGAWGVQSASKPIREDRRQTERLRGRGARRVIKDPTNFDAHNKPASAKGRWAYVLASNDAWRRGATGVLGRRIEQELLALGFTEQQVTCGWPPQWCR
ncbi:biosynthetic peptidoglycan transglycosylase [Cryptosporangium phraense]|uniref:biosynthetic peptidoglycan transglycosylase n=1 Tax=Cryptosporangium phraense TaxID=2593070 RepID=UPI0014784419|nr:biosynthetic peptidoglycan transglycosylase [Cryptosporangium phraense]